MDSVTKSVCRGGLRRAPHTAAPAKSVVLMRLVPVFLVLMPVLLWAPAVHAAEMTGEEIRSTIVGRRIYLKAPGGEFPLNYRRGGVIDGDGEALGLGNYLKPQDSGRWWIQGQKLCQQFKTWYKGERLCFVLTQYGDGRLAWRRDNGETGTARVGPALE